MKLSIIGMGRVGATLAYTLVLEQRLSDLVLVSSSKEKAQADALDLSHAQLFVNTQTEIQAGSIEDTKNSDLIVVTASKKMSEAVTDRRELAQSNYKLFQEIIPPLTRLSPSAILLIITNPVDVMTYAAIKLSGFPAKRVIGTGTLIDSNRFRSLLSKEVGIHPLDLRAYVIGEHGKNQVAVFSEATAGGEKMDITDQRRKLFQKSQELGNEVYRKKGYTNFAIAAAANYIIEAIANDSRYTAPVSVLVEDFLGIRNVCLSLPSVIGSVGIARILQPDLSESEAEAFRKSAALVQETMKSIGL